MPSALSLGLIGFGEWARSAYAPILKTLDQVEVAGVAAPSRETRQQAREMLGEDVFTTGDYRELLDRADVDGVMIAVPNPRHCEVALAAIQRGKHVFLELPVALKEEDVEAVLRAAEAFDGVVQFDFELRYMPVARALRQWIDQGTLGRPLEAAVDLRTNWGYGPDEPGEPARAGFYLWLGPWYLDMLDLMLDGPFPRRARVAGGRAMNGSLLDHGHALVEYESGAIGRFSHTLVSTCPQVRVSGRVMGERGELEVDFERGIISGHAVEGPIQETCHPPKQPVYGWAGMRESIESFVAAMARGGPVEGGTAVARRVHQAVFACHRADQEARSSGEES